MVPELRHVHSLDYRAALVRADVSSRLADLLPDTAVALGQWPPLAGVGATSVTHGDLTLLVDVRAGRNLRVAILDRLARAYNVIGHLRREGEDIVACVLPPGIPDVDGGQTFSIRLRRSKAVGVTPTR